MKTIPENHPCLTDSNYKFSQGEAESARSTLYLRAVSLATELEQLDGTKTVVPGFTSEPETDVAALRGVITTLTVQNDAAKNRIISDAKAARVEKPAEQAKIEPATVQPASKPSAVKRVIKVDGIGTQEITTNATSELLAKSGVSSLAELHDKRANERASVISPAYTPANPEREQMERMPTGMTAKICAANGVKNLAELRAKKAAKLSTGQD
jgi:hypothetical protein